MFLQWPGSSSPRTACCDSSPSRRASCGPGAGPERPSDPRANAGASTRSERSVESYPPPEVDRLAFVRRTEVLRDAGEESCKEVHAEVREEDHRDRKNVQG